MTISTILSSGEYCRATHPKWYFVAKERAYRHTATHYAYSCSVDWQGAVMAQSIPVTMDG